MSTPDTGLDPAAEPDITVSAAELFGIRTSMQVPAFSKADERVPDLDEAYVFDPDTTLAILAGFAIIAG